MVHVKSLEVQVTKRLQLTIYLLFIYLIYILDEQCLCSNSYTGRFCETEITAICKRHTPCYNGASCINNICVCSKDYIGVFCEYESKKIQHLHYL